MKVVYVGIFDEVFVPDLTSVVANDKGERGIVKKGHPIEIEDDLAKRLLAQKENWQVSGVKEEASLPDRKGRNTDA